MNTVIVIWNLLCLRHCEERSDKAIQTAAAEQSGLLRFARNDDQIDGHDNNTLPDDNASAIIEA
jgi:hypothetical protein